MERCEGAQQQQQQRVVELDSWESWKQTGCVPRSGMDKVTDVVLARAAPQWRQGLAWMEISSDRCATSDSKFQSGERDASQLRWPGKRVGSASAKPN